MRHTSYSHGSRTSISTSFSPASSRFLSSAVVISSSLIEGNILSASASRELRRALLEKRMHAFQAILGCKTLHLMFDFIFERPLEHFLLIREQDFLHGANRKWRS